ncbi:MAG TPA: hypothetical protein VMB66_03760 [Candidatus Acidoferrales bacterium]|nr:hypothetical protein [Candidatus Acidoferrales bacterium]
MTAKNCLFRWILVVALFMCMAAIFSAAQSEHRNPQRSASQPPNSVTSTAIPASMFDMTAHSDVLSGTPWPTMPIYGMRLWDTDSAWAQLNPSKGVYDWTTLDSWVSAASANNVQLIYTFGQTPAWASSKPKDSTCDYEAGACDPPSDLNSDGTGTDQHFINFVTAIAQHAPSITYWEMWNTPHDTSQWTGTNAQLVRMVKDANTYIKKYIPGAKIISPANGQLNYSYPASNCTMPDKMGGYLAAGLGQYIDIMALHTYYTTVPEDIVPVVQCYQSTMKTYNVSSLPLWSTEGAWGFNTDLPSTVDQAGFVARLYLLLWSNGVVRHYWYAWDDQNTGTLSDNGIINSVGVAYQQVESWMSGRTMSTLCSENSSGIWTCGLTGSNGYSAQAVWHPGGNTTYSAPTQYVNYLDLSGTQHNLSSGTTVTVGEEPILLQSASVTQSPNFAVSEPSPFPEVIAGSSGTSSSLTISSENGFTGTVTLSCPTTFGSGSCSVSPSSVASFPATATLVINGTSFSPGTYQISVQGSSGSLTNSLNVPFSVGDFSITGPASFSSPSSGQATANLTLASLYSYSGQITAACDASAISGAQCTLSPASPISLTGGASVPITASVTIPTNAAAGTYNINLNLQGTNGDPSHSLTVPVTVGSTIQDFGFGSFSPASQSISPGQSASYAFTVSPVGSSFPNAVTFSCSGIPALTQCTFTPNPVTPGNGSAAVTMTITTTPNSSTSRRFGAGALLVAPWLILPGFVFLGAGKKARRKSLAILSLLLLLLLALTLTACSGATGISNNNSGVQQQHQGTQPGTYPITVTGTSGALTHQTAAVTLIVTQ